LKDQDEDHQSPTNPVIMGSPEHFWLWTEEQGFDLTRPDTPTSGPRAPNIRLETDNTPITICTTNTAFVIIDMMNQSLSQPLNPRHIVRDIETFIIKRAIPAVRKAGIQVIWVNWGLTDEDLANIPPTTQRIWVYEMDGTYKHGQGIGWDMGAVEIEDGTTVQGVSSTGNGTWVNRVVYCATGTDIYISAG
jgi:hypothetical protein